MSTWAIILIGRQADAGRADGGAALLAGFVGLNALEELWSTAVCPGLAGQRWQGVPGHLGELVEPRGPGRQPAMPALQGGQGQLGMAIENAGADQRRHVALRI